MQRSQHLVPALGFSRKQRPVASNGYEPEARRILALVHDEIARRMVPGVDLRKGPGIETRGKHSGSLSGRVLRFLRRSRNARASPCFQTLMAGAPDGVQGQVKFVMVFEPLGNEQHEMSAAQVPQMDAFADIKGSGSQGSPNLALRWVSSFTSTWRKACCSGEKAQFTAKERTLSANRTRRRETL